MKRYYAVCAGVAAVLVTMTLISGSEPVKFFGRFSGISITKPAFADAVAGAVSGAPSPGGIGDISVDPAFTSVPLEASGIAYLDDLRSFLIVSDDTDRKRPDLFLMDTTGRVTSRAVIRGLDKINDMESIVASDPDRLYVLASQSYNRKGKQPASRMLFARVRRKGAALKLDGSVRLFSLLLAAASGSPSEKWAEFILISDRDESIDIEGMAVFNDTLLLGFKNPKLENHAVLLAVADFNAVIDGGKLSPRQISLWRALPLYDTSTGTFCGISDLAVKGNRLWGTATGVSSKSGVDEDVGLFWKYSPSTDFLRIIRNFSGIKPEGVAVYGDPPHYCMVFDNGAKNPSQFLIGKEPL